MKTDSYPIFMLPRIVVKMKNGGDVSAIIEKYKDKLTYNPNSQILSGLTIFESNVNNSNDLLMLVEEISKLEEVAWAEPDYSGGYHLTFLTRGRNNII
jgi:exoribonuclease II